MISLEMRVGGDEAHIKIGLAELYIAAAPVLKLLAIHDLTYIPQCLIYLIEGLSATAINDPQSQPSAAIMDALREIYAGVDQRYMSSILQAIDAFNPEYNHTLLKYCPQWGTEGTTT